MQQLIYGNTETEALTSYVNMLTNTPLRDLGIDYILDEVRRYFHADRSYIFEVDHSLNVVNNTYECCAEGISAEIDNLQDIPVEAVEIWFEEFRKQGSFLLKNDSSYARECPIIHEILEPQGISTLMAAPITLQGEFVGFLGVDNPRVQTDHRMLLSVIASSLYKEIIFIRESALIEEQKQLRGTMEHILQSLEKAGMGVWAILGVDTPQPRMVVTDQMKQLLGLPSAPMTAEEVYAFWHSRIAREFLPDVDAFLEAMRSGEHSEVTYMWEHPSKEAVYMRTGGGRSVTAKGNLILEGYHTDVTDIVKKEQEDQISRSRTMRSLRKALREAETAREEVMLDREIISSISKLYFAIFRIDLQKNFYEEISSDSEVHRLTGHEGNAQEKMQELCRTFVSEEYRADISMFFDLSSVPDRLRDTETIDMSYHAVDGNWHSARFIAKKRDESGRVTHILYVTRLVSEEMRREIRQQALLKEALEEAEKANRAKTMFLNNMSHDIRTPMNAILGFARLMKLHISEPDVLTDYLMKIENSGEYLLSIINHVLDMARIESGQIVLDEGVVDLGNEDSYIPKLFSEDIRKKDLHFTHENRVRHRYVLSDEARLTQILVNLLSNAIKYTPEGGSIHLSTTELPCSREGYATYVTTVSDTGIGMSKEFQSHIFESFTRERTTTESKVIGTGLGMSIVKKLVDLFGGTIDVRSTLGKGSTFRVVLTLKTVDDPGSLSADIDQSELLDADISGKRILLTEDNDLNAEIATEILESLDLIVERAADGVECVGMVNKAAAGYYDLILMDIQMPHLNGYEATRKIRHMPDPEKSAIPIIAMTANVFDEDRKRSSDAGMNGHLAKPIEMQKLLDTLARFLS